MNATGVKTAYSKERILRGFLRLYALLFALAFLLDDKFLAALIRGDIYLGGFQWACLILLALFVGMDTLIGRAARLRELLTADAALNTMLAGLAALMPLIMLELALRPFAHFPNKDVSIFQRDAEIGWGLLPNIEIEYGGVTVRTNSMGLRSPEIEVDKVEDEFRILVLGDSVAFGFRLDDDETFPAVLERRLREGELINPLLSPPPILGEEKASKAKRFHVVNSGVPGYCTLQQARWLRRHGIELAPNVVILAFVLNDVIPNLTGMQMGDFGTGDPTPFIRNTLWDGIQGNSALIYFSKRIFHQKSYGRTLRESAIYQEMLGVRELTMLPTHPKILKAWEATYACLDDILEQCETLNARFLLAVFPYYFQMDDPETLSAPQEALRVWAERRGAAYLDLLPYMVEELRKQCDNTRAYFMDESHLSVEGSEWTGEMLANELLWNYY